ncbi:hypothetical protein AAFF_G00382810 [Aldrovandia affinis]|uniref:Uncharacterized protein n=1 Tax=Aldrovandia affinis TaxID=143900 RepID=A0AAD7T8A5_9TELE|nr:hypothetical protein AAFF_G00382810 [Aldrovandia affinis]
MRWMPYSALSLRMVPPSYSSVTSTCRRRPLRPLHSSPCFSPLTSPWLNPHLPTRPVPARISACLADISAWMSAHYLKLNLGKTELLFLPAKGSPIIDASITVEGSIVSPSQSARSLGVTLDNQLCFSSHIAVTPLLSSLHWLPIAAHIRFKSLVLAFQAARGTAPVTHHSLHTSQTPPLHLLG